MPLTLFIHWPAGALRPLKRAVIWLVRADRPVPSRSDAEIAAEVESNYPWNFAVNLLDGAFFWFGASFASSTTILPLFVSRLTTHPLAIGLLAVISQGAWFLPQLFTANLVERLARKKPVIVNLGLFLERLPIWGLVLAALVAGRSPLLALVIFLSCYAWHGLGAGMIATSWQDMIARIFPVDRRGRFLGLTNFTGAGTGALGAGLSTWLLKTYPFPTNFVYAFTIAATCVAISWFWLALAREPAQPATTPRQSNWQFLAGLPDLLRRDHNFRRFLITRLLMTLGGMGMGFVTVSAVERWQVPDSTAGIFTIALLIGQTAGNLVFGFMADRFGHKVCLEVGILASCLGFTATWLAPASEWYYVAFLLFGIGYSTVFNSGLLVVMEFGDPQRRPTYVGIVNTGVGMVGILAPMLGAGLASLPSTGSGAGAGSCGWLFAASAGVNLMALVLMYGWVKEPRWAETGRPPN